MAEITGTPGNDVPLDGTPEDDIIRALAGDDDIFADAGDDQVFAGEGLDFLRGDPGNDLLDGGPDLDAVLYDDAPSRVIIDLQRGVVTGGFGRDTLVSIEGVNGSRFADVITLANGGESALARAGNDVVRGLAGDDYILPGSGNDVILGGAGANDFVDYTQNDDPAELGTRGVTVDLVTGVATDNWGDRDILSGIEHIRGGPLGDVLRGEARFNFIAGEGGDDFITGREGPDIFQGDAGADTLIYTTDRDSRPGVEDEVRDFDAATGDRIDLSLVDAVSATRANDSFTFVGDDAITAPGQVRLASHDGFTAIQANTRSDAAPELVIVLADVDPGSLTGDAFIL